MSFNVYRGSTPAQLFRIASNQAIAAQFTDTGLGKQLIAPLDPNFDHANFYWRMELQSESAVTIHSATTVGNDGLHMTANRYLGMIARITRGRGAGQERAIAANTATELTVSPAWTEIPDASSFFVVAETGWQFGALATSSPVQFAVPNRGGETVQVCGRAANVNNLECAAELSTVTRWQIGGSGTTDVDVPPEPFFGLGAGQSAGTVELSGVSFTDLTNTSTISAATLTLHYWDELRGRPTLALAQAAGIADTTLQLSAAGDATAGSFVQIDSEVIRVEAVANGGTQYQVTRGMHSSPAAAHAAQAAVYHAAEQDGDRGVSVELLRESLQRELEPGSEPAGRAGGECGVVRHERARQQSGEEYLPDQFGGPGAADAYRVGSTRFRWTASWRWNRRSLRRWWWRRRTRCGTSSRCWGVWRTRR